MLVAMGTTLPLPLLVIMLLATRSQAYPTGAPPEACANLDPIGHGPSTNQGPAPYDITFSDAHYTPGKELEVTLSGKNGETFMGFLVEVRPVPPASKQTLGTFRIPDGAVYQEACKSKTGNGVTQKDPTLKSNVTLYWTAPAGTNEDITFHFTVVRGKTGPPDYFKDLQSEVLKASGSNPSDNFEKDPECGKTKGCYSNCKPDGTCDWLVSWTKHDDDTASIGLMSIVKSDNKYVAMGFSEQAGMEKASVVACRRHGGNVSVIASFNPGYYNSPLPNPAVDSAQGSFVDGVLNCTFLRNKTSENPKIFNLTEPWHLITARGDVSTDGSIQPHVPTNCHFTGMTIDVMASVRDVPFNGADVTTSQRPPVSTTIPPPAKKFKKDPACGVIQGCYSDCDDGICDFLLSWKKKGSDYEFTMTSGFNTDDNHYVALGLSHKEGMYPASVAQCVGYNGKVGASLSYNGDYSNQKLKDNTQKIVTQIKNSFKDGVLSCTFTRPTQSNNSRVYDLNQEYYLITARGAVSGGVMIPHDVQNRFLTSTRVSLADPSVDISMEESTYPLVKVHGCLMVLAWILSASIGIAMARFFKPVWPDTTVFGVKVWFFIHRSCMVLTFCLGVAAFIVIFVEVDGYSEIIGEDYKKAHPILGIIVTALLVINPFMSLLRCDPSHPQRPIFNWAHFLVGTSAHILSAVTIAIGLYLPKARADGDTGLLIVIVFGSWQVLFFCIMSALDYLAKNDSKLSSAPLAQKTPKAISYTIENDLSQVNLGNSTDDIMSESQEQVTKHETKMSTAKQWVMSFHVVVLVAVAAYLMYLIIDTDV